MISLEGIIEIHSILIERFGGMKGIRDLSALKSCLERPLQTFDQRDLYPTPIDKAAAIVESFVKNHPFNDGNKRIGYVSMRLFLMQENLDINADEEDKYQFVIGIADGSLEFDQIKAWIMDKAYKS
jgi:death-on-curing protein